MHQVLGADLVTPSELVVCWTEDGALKGGTAQALRLAMKLDIPVFNLGADDGYELLANWFRAQRTQ